MTCGVRSQRALLRDSGRVRYEDLRVETAAAACCWCDPRSCS